MITAPRDGTPVLLRFRSPVPNTREDLRQWDGLVFVGRYGGDLEGWSFAAPVGMGGFPSGWMACWAPLPAESLRLPSEAEPSAATVPPHEPFSGPGPDLEGLEKVEAFLAHVETRSGSLIFFQGKTLHPKHLRALISRLRGAEEALEDAKASIRFRDGLIARLRNALPEHVEDRIVRAAHLEAALRRQP